MATITSLGVGSNLDLATLLKQLQTAESQPLVALDEKAKSYTTKLSAYNTVRSALGVLQTAAKKLSDPALFQTVTGTPTVSGILAASSTDASSAGNYSITVSQLAQSQSAIAAGQASTTTAIGSGKITIDFGTITGGTLDPATGKYGSASFAADASRVAKPITIDASNNTLAGIRDAINGADAGVTASIVNDGSGTPNRLVLVSTQTGAASSMRISVDGDAALQTCWATTRPAPRTCSRPWRRTPSSRSTGSPSPAPATRSKEAIQGSTPDAGEHRHDRLVDEGRTPDR